VIALEEGIELLEIARQSAGIAAGVIERCEQRL